MSSYKGNMVALSPFQKEHGEKVFQWFYSPDYEFFFRDYLKALEPSEFDKLDESMARYGQKIAMLIDNESGDVAGMMTYKLEKPSVGVFNFGILLDKAHQHAGKCIDACAGLCRYLFELEGARKVICDVSVEDEHLNRIILKGGFVLEGTFKEEILLNERYIDENRYRLMRDEYFAIYQDYFGKDSSWSE